MVDGGSERVVASFSELKTALSEFRQSKGSEIFLHRNDGSWTGVLVNGDRAVVTLSVEIDLENYYATGEAFSGQDFLIPFRLSNGQVDEYPRSSTMPVDQAMASIEGFFTTGARSNRIAWQTTDPFEPRYGSGV